MTAALHRFPSTSTESSTSTSEHSTAASSSFTSPPSQKTSGIPNHGQSGQLQSTESRVKDLTTSDLAALLATRLAKEKRVMQTAPIPPAYPFPDFFLPTTKPPKKIKAASDGKKKGFSLFGGGSKKASSQLSSSSTHSSPNPSLVERARSPSISSPSMQPRRYSGRSQLSAATDATSIHSVAADKPVSTLDPEVQKVLDTATRVLAKSLKLSLVYLCTLDLSTSAHTLTLLSSSGLPSPAPAFDPALHFEALRAPEGGLLYQNTKKVGYSAGLLVPILEVRQAGYCLCGFTDSNDPSYFGQREMERFVAFATQLEPWVSKVGRV
ncbi:hypothetical protein RQP46_010526 [Phenoliferia psychrophenolica]